MQQLTANMHDVALKTKQETVSMRIITVVALIFLPGTFTSVGFILGATSVFPYQADFENRRL